MIKLGIYETENLKNFAICSFALNTNNEFKKYAIIRAFIYPTAKAKLACKKNEYAKANIVPFNVFIPPMIINRPNSFLIKLRFTKLII